MIQHDLYKLKNHIEGLSKEHHIDILHLLLKNNCDVSENQNGNFVNLTRLTDTVLNEIKEYMDYVEFQNESLKEIERKKEQLVNKYFNNIPGKCNFFSENSET